MKHQETGDYIEEADELILRCVNDLSLAIISAEQQKEFYLLLVCNVFDIWSFKQVMFSIPQTALKENDYKKIYI